MTFKVKGGIQIGANVAVDEAALLQQIELNPSVRPTILFDFAKGKTVDARSTFTRATAATYVDSDGYIKTARANQPRFEYTSNGVARGLHFEVYKANLVSSSEYFHTWTSANTVVAPASTQAPDGTFTGTKVYDFVDAIASPHSLLSANVAVSNGVTYTYSLFAKSAELTRVSLYPINGSNGAFFNLSTGTVVSADTGITAAIEPYKNGWYRCSTTITANAAINATPRIYLLNNGTYYIGDGTKGVHVWGAQFEQAEFASSYIPTGVSGHSRSSTASYRDNADGYIKTAAVNTIRYNYNPVTRTNTSYQLEPAATNLLTYSENFTQWGVSGVTATNNDSLSPSNTTTAAKITENTSLSRHYIAPISSPSITANTIATVSCFLKAGTRTRAYIWIGMSGTPYTRAGVVVDLTTGNTVVSNVNVPAYYASNVEDYGDGWYRVSVSGKVDDVNTNAYVEIGGADNTNATSYQGDGSYFYVWGVQIENTMFSTSYIPTSGAAATRAADTFTSTTADRYTDTLTMPASSAALRPYEGTVAMEVEMCSNVAGNQYVFSLGDGTVNSLISYRFISGKMDFVVYNQGIISGYTTPKDPYTANTVIKTASAFSNSGIVSACDGVITSSSLVNSGIPPYGTVAVGGGFSASLNAYVKNVVYYPTKLSNTELITISSS